MSALRVDSIQALRAVAAIAVVFYHAQLLIAKFPARYGGDDAWRHLADTVHVGQCGVDIFFVISGFIMALVTNDMHKRKGAVWDFAQKRLIRIFPPYWLWTSVLLFLLFFFPQLFSTQTFALKEALLSCLLIPYKPLGANPSPALAVGWTLSYEMYFYALVGIGLLFSRKRCIVGLGIFFLIATAIFPQRHGPVSSLTANPLLWEFYAGVLLFEAYKAGARLPAMLSMCLAILAMTAFYYSSEQGLSHLRCIYWGIPSLTLVASCIFLEKETGWRVPKMFVFLGDTSYTLYLSHYITLPGMGKASAMVGLHTILPPDILIILYTAACIVLGCVLYVTTEKPLLHYCRNKRVAFTRIERA